MSATVPPPALRTAPAHSPGAGVRVLLIEDNPSDALIIRTLLAGGGATVAHAEWLRDALELLAHAEFDVILLDMLLPDARELEALELLRRREPHLPVVVLTARDDEALAVRAVRAGAQEYLCKGRMDADVLLRSLRHAVERHRLLARLEVALARGKAAEHALQRREEYFRALIENASDVTAVVEMDGTLCYVSPSVTGVLGYRPVEVMGLRAVDLVHPDDRPALLRCFTRARRGHGFAPAAEYRARHRDGSWRTLHSVASSQFGNPAVRGLVVNSRDTTARTEAERAREDALSLLRATLEATADGIVVVDQRGEPASWNQQLATMWELPEPAQPALRAGGFLRHLLDRLADPEPFRSAVEADPTGEGFDVLELRDGRVIERYARPQRIGGAVVGGVWSFRDVTERRRLEARALHAQKIAAIGQLAGGIAHDFNNVLMTIQGTTALLLDDVPEASPFRTELGDIARSAEHAAGLTRQLLAFSRRQHLHPEVTDLNRGIAEMGRMLARVLGPGIEIACLLHPGLARVRVDPGQLQQVVMNLALNARDAMPGGGRLTIRTAPLAAADPRLAGCIPFPAGAVALEVEDTGTGMDPATLARIFEPFFTRKPAGRGTGLGLPTVDGIVRQSGGDLLVDSTPGVGTRFTILLPPVSSEEPSAPEDAPAADASTAAQAAVLAPETILVVDDTELVRRVTRRILERGGYRVIEAASAEPALRLAEPGTGDIHLLLSDVVMPGMSGPAMAERFLERRPGTPVVFMSGYSDEDALEGEALNGRAARLQKPFDPARLLRVVREALDGG